MNELETVIAAHSDAVWRTVYRLLNNYDDALDCYQETFLAALRLSTSHEVRYWRTMLLRIATRKAIDHLRARYQAEKTATALRSQSVEPAAAENPESHAQCEELQEHVCRAMASLPSQQAEAFWLRHLEELSVDEIAALMDVETGHVRVLVHRAAVGLRSLLGTTYRPAHIREESS